MWSKSFLDSSAWFYYPFLLFNLWLNIVGMLSIPLLILIIGLFCLIIAAQQLARSWLQSFLRMGMKNAPFYILLLQRPAMRLVCGMLQFRCLLLLDRVFIAFAILGLCMFMIAIFYDWACSWLWSFMSHFFLFHKWIVIFVPLHFWLCNNTYTILAFVEYITWWSQDFGQCCADSGL